MNILATYNAGEEQSIGDYGGQASWEVGLGMLGVAAGVWLFFKLIDWLLARMARARYNRHARRTTR